ncbi:MAG: class GN sortase [endosymbiont of Galathealinum brachiosum]|uniref:Class GN sortase n=1 Tax=endosymbiont of Galathealinum brachiosum TaxID=2200906 RepID=A0A370DDN7_9GAMM|nr:MAG: class GN sortase [endosymbiont of Galathealinum brachiosum]
MKNIPGKPYIIIFLFIPGCWFIAQGTYVHVKAFVAQQLLEQAWSNVKSGKTKSKPWPWADTWPIARLKVPRLDIDLIVLAGDSGRTLAFGPGHNFASVMPGVKGNSLISAHRDTHFNFLKYLKPDDNIVIDTAQSDNIIFKVISTKIVEMDNARFLNDQSGEYIHLVTCYPFDSIVPGGSQRYIVSARASSS